MQDTGTASRPYALAAFKQAREDGNVGEWGRMLETLDAIAADPTMKGLIVNPKVQADRLAALINDVAGDRLSRNGRNFVRLLAEYGRLGLISEIRAIFDGERAALEGRGQVEVHSAYPLSAEQESRIGEAMSKRLGVNVELTVAIDEALIGGFVVRAGDLVIDASLRGRLNQLRKSLT